MNKPNIKNHKVFNPRTENVPYGYYKDYQGVIEVVDITTNNIVEVRKTETECWYIENFATWMSGNIFYTLNDAKMLENDDAVDRLSIVIQEAKNKLDKLDEDNVPSATIEIIPNDTYKFIVTYYKLYCNEKDRFEKE